MVTVRPAFSASFHSDRLAVVAPLGLVGMSREWAWQNSSGEGVKVAVIDSGVDAAHPDVGSIQGYVAIRQDQDRRLAWDTNPHNDRVGHATACASVIRSLAPDCEIYSVKVFEDRLTADGAVLAAALRWAIDNGIHVCNLSVGTIKREFSSILHELADLAYFRNVILVTAANNAPIPSFPSVYASAISVAAHDVQDPYTFYYNPEPPAEFGALGIDVRLAWVGQQHITATGNSYAAAHITGLVSKILAKHPGLTPFQLKTILRELASNVDRPGIPRSSSPLQRKLPAGESTVL